MSLKIDRIAGGAMLAVIGGGLGAVYWAGRHAGAAAERPKTLAAAASAAAFAAQARAAGDAARITDAAAARTQTIILREGDHRAAILSAKGADAPLDPDVVAAARRRLCEYEAYRGDDACALLGADAAQLPPAGAAGAPAGS